MDFNGSGAIGGATAGAGIGSYFAPGFGTAIGAGVGGLAGGLGLFGRPQKQQVPDISGELANLRGIFEKLRAQANAGINQQSGYGRQLAASSLAGRGIYSSPVSENTFNQLERERMQAIASSDASLSGQEAQLRTGLLSQLLGLNMQAQQLRAQQGASTMGQLGSIGGSLLLSSLLRGQGGGAGVPRTGTVSGGQVGGWMPYYG